MPVDLPTLGAFLIAAGAIVLTPGPDTVLILRNAMSGGRDVGLATVFGVQLGLVVHTALAVLGLSVLIATSPLLFRTVAIAGALYLGWLGLQAFRGRGGLKVDADAKPITAHAAIRDAMICNLLNPKVILLFLALFPQFLNPDGAPITHQLIALAIVLVVINVAWQAPMAFVADKARVWMERPSVNRIAGYCTGAIFIGFAVFMLIDHVL
ncbi:MAG: LysE family translocator [Magnetovibrionaceae bacterium]